MPIENFTPTFMAKGLVCPPGKSKIEYSVAGEPGLFVECRASAKAVPTWYLRMKNAAGTNVYKNLGTIKELTLAQAKKRATLVRAEHAKALSASTTDPVEALKSDTTLDMFMKDQYMPHATMHKRSAKKDDQLYRLHIAPRFKDHKLGSITRHEVQIFHSDLIKKGQSPASADHSIKLMRRTLNLAVEWDFIEKNPLNRFKLFMVDNQVDNYLSDREVEQLVKVLKADDNRVVSMAIMLLLVTGARLNEALTAKWENIKLDATTESGVWKVDASVSKSKRSRSIPLNSSAVWVLNQLGTKAGSAYVFPSPVTGKPYTAITRTWYRLRKKAGISCRIHDLRHTFASVLAAKGQSLYVIQRLLGHADSRMTQRYAHISTEVMLDAANEMAVHLVA